MRPPSQFLECGGVEAHRDDERNPETAKDQIGHDQLLFRQE